MPKQIHLKCSRLNKQRFLEYKRVSTSFTCQFCSDYCCFQCNKHVYYGQKGVLCSGCDKWIHQKCVGFSPLEYKMLSQDDSNYLKLSETMVSQAQLVFICSNSAIMAIIVVVVDSQHINARWNSLLP